MRSAVRYLIAAASGLSGLAAIVLILKPGLVPAQTTWLMGAVTLLLALALTSTALSVLEAPSMAGQPSAAPDATDADRQMHGEMGKVVGNLRSMVEASGNFKAVLDKANDQLPRLLKADQVQLVISYLMVENESMRQRTGELQGSLEQSQRTVERLKANLAKAEEQGLNDGLTGLRNRRGFDITLAAEMATSRTASRPLSLIIADIDHFKLVNDRYGHQTGDEVLQWFAKVLASNMKGRDTVCRYGGEEFAIILPQTKLDGASTLAGQIKQQLEAKFWSKPGAPNTVLKITASFGVAQFSGGEGSSAFIQRADAKLYESKQAGRNRVAA